MRDVVHGMLVFSKVVEAGSLSAAARELGVSTAVVSRTLAALEARLGVRLVNRTTRSLHLTDEGASYYETSQRILGEIDEADAAVTSRRVEPQGVLRVALPASFGHQHIAPLVPRFAQRYPKVELALSLSDRAINLIEEGFDLAVRIAELKDSSLAARKLAPNRRVVCASPANVRPTRDVLIVALQAKPSSAHACARGQPAGHGIGLRQSGSPRVGRAAVRRASVQNLTHSRQLHQIKRS
jgi:DNA-binding transcriptional LysR family regulator